MAEDFVINVGKTFIVHNYNDKLQTGGHVYSQGMRLSYEEADGVTFTQDQLLYTEGQIGGPIDFFEIRSQIDQTLGASGYISIVTTCQTNVPPGTVITRTISIGGSLPFDMTISYN